MHYIYLLQRINALAERENVHSVFVIIDNNSRRVDKWAAYAFCNYLYRSTARQELGRVLEVPIFGDSAMTTGIQLADIVAGVLRHYFTEGLHATPLLDSESLYHKNLRRFHQIICNQSPNFGSLKGLYLAPPNFFANYLRLLFKW